MRYKETPYSAAEMRLLTGILQDPLKFIECNLKIADKMGNLVPLIYNAQQMRLHREIERQEKLGQPVRIIVLKARQIGFSTCIAGEFYARVARTQLTRAKIVAHNAEASSNIFAKMKMFYEKSHPALQPMSCASNAKELIFDNPSPSPQERKRNPGLKSSIRINTAENPEAGRSDTVHLLHLSEVAFWRNPQKSMTSLMQSVPNLPGTMVIIESTANGVGGYFYEEWQRAVAGESGFVPLFFPWHEYDGYEMPVPEGFVLTEEEKELKNLYQLSDRKLAWRRWCIMANCQNSEDVFHQEYPTVPEEAFISTGRPVFDVKALGKALLGSRKPIKTGRVVEIYEEKRKEKVVAFQAAYNGYLRIWEEPEDGEDYVIGIDVALGKEGGDYSCMQVIKKSTAKVVAVWHGHIDPDLLGTEASFLGRWYNLALLVPEANNHGLATIISLRRHRYPRIFRRRSEGRVEDRITRDYGWLTTTKTKPQAIAVLTRIIREDAARLTDPDTIRECMSYVIGEDGKTTNAQEGCHDDRVMALAIAYRAMDYNTYAETSPQFEEANWQEVYHASKTTGY